MLSVQGRACIGRPSDDSVLTVQLFSLQIIQFELGRCSGAAIFQTPRHKRGFKSHQFFHNNFSNLLVEDLRVWHAKRAREVVHPVDPIRRFQVMGLALSWKLNFVYGHGVANTPAATVELTVVSSDLSITDPVFAEKIFRFINMFEDVHECLVGVESFVLWVSCWSMFLRHFSRRRDSGSMIDNVAVRLCPVSWNGIQRSQQCWFLQTLIPRLLQPGKL